MFTLILKISTTLGSGQSYFYDYLDLPDTSEVTEGEEKQEEGESTEDTNDNGKQDSFFVEMKLLEKGYVGMMCAVHSW